MNRFPQALFRAGGAEVIEGKPFTSKMVQDEEQLEAARAEGFRDTTDEALSDADAKLAEAKKDSDADGSDDNRPPSRAELEVKAKELGIEFKAQTSNKKLAELVDAKLAEATQ